VGNRFHALQEKKNNKTEMEKKEKKDIINYNFF
jgi:hypothetical protein